MEMERWELGVGAGVAVDGALRKREAKRTGNK